MVASLTLDPSEEELNRAPQNTDLPNSVIAQVNTDAAIDFLAMFDPDAGSGTMQTTLSVLHGTLTFADDGGAALSGNGTGTVTLTGTAAQINAAFGGQDKVNLTYRGAPDFFGTDTLTMTTSDNGNTGAGGPLSDTDQVNIIVKPTSTGTTDGDAFVAPAGSASIDASGGADTITFDFRLVDATVRYVDGKVIIDGPSSHTVLKGFETFVFTDGTVNNADGNLLVDDLFYYSQNHDVWNAHVDADQHYITQGWHEGRDPSTFFSTSFYLAVNPDVKAAGIDPLAHWHASGWQEDRLPSIAFDGAKYLELNPAVAAAQIDPLWHFFTIGVSEGREAVAPTRMLAANGFDFIYYLQQNPDVAAAGVDPYWHFQNLAGKRAAIRTRCSM